LQGLIVQYKENAKKEENALDHIGIYLHIPFCDGKCPYCDFYSMKADERRYDEYIRSLTERMYWFAGQTPRRADTLYIGGGTPSLLGGERISELICRSRALFGLEEAEITVECNPRSSNGAFFREIAAAGANRVSIGMQSASEEELLLLGRRHHAEDAAETVAAARQAGIDNISLDLMIGTPGQTTASLLRSADFCIAQGVKHISAYMLKIEEGTRFDREDIIDRCPDGDETADMYEQLCKRLERNGFERYEISNFAVTGFESRHNLKYWHCEEYLGLGPAAHSFVNGRRLYYPRSIEKFMDSSNPEPLFDCEGGGFEEYVMLRLRLREGIDLQELQQQYPDCGLNRTQQELLEKNGFLHNSNGRISLTTKGVLVSNEIISRLLA